jgi:hypothetical protein
MHLFKGRPIVFRNPLGHREIEIGGRCLYGASFRRSLEQGEGLVEPAFLAQDGREKALRFRARGEPYDSVFQKSDGFTRETRVRSVHRNALQAKKPPEGGFSLC